MSIYDFARDVRGEGRRRRLLVDEDFSWSEVPHRRAATAVADQVSESYIDHQDLVGDRQDPHVDHQRPHVDHLPEPVVARGAVDVSDYGEGLDDGVEVLDLRESYPHFAGERGAGYEEAFDDPYLDEDVPPDGDHHSSELAERGGSSTGGRRTIVITGHGAEHRLPVRRRPEAGLRVHERSGFKPDRIALWAFLLALALLLGATTSSHAAMLVHHLPH